MALYEGNESRLGRTAWQSLDSMAVTAVLAQVGKYTFSRERPTETPDAGMFFQGKGHLSFPSGEVANVAAAFTPFVLEYGREYPAVTVAAAATLIYDAEARMKARAHWQTDVIAGAMLGGGIGYLMHQREESLILAPFGKGVFVGFKKRF
jgi:undecaprenyl-diphosphatase